MANILNPVEQFFDLDGSPLDEGYIYLGNANSNPETSPVQVYWDLGNTIPAAQPIRTINGYPVRNGTPAPFYSVSAVSMMVRNKKKLQVFYAATTALTVLSQNISVRTANTMLNQSDSGKEILGTGTFTQTFDAAASLGAGWSIKYANIGTGVITFDPNLTETIDGFTVEALYSGQSCTIYCDGVALRTAGLYLSNEMILTDSVDATKTANFDLSLITTAIRRVYTMPDKNGTLAMTSDLTLLFPRSYISGLTLSTVGASSTMNVAAGVASDSANTVVMSLAAPLAKTTGAWVVGNGNGGLDTGVIAINTWYYFFLIQRIDTGVTDVIFSLSSSLPALPANYTKYRYIGANITNASSQWTLVTQVGDEFYYGTPPALDFNAVGSTVAALLTCSVPRGRKVKAFFNISTLAPAGTVVGTYISDPANADIAPSSSLSPLLTAGFSNSTANNTIAFGQVQCWTNSSAQIRHRELTANTLQIQTLGWIDLRDRSL